MAAQRRSLSRWRARGSCRSLRVLVITVALQLVGELGAARGGDAPGGQYMHAVGADIVEQALVVGDDQHAAFWRTHAVHALGDHLEGVDVEAGVGLIEDQQARREQRYLED